MLASLRNLTLDDYTATLSNVCRAFHRFINTIAVCISGADAVCMAVLTIAALEWEGTENAKRADNAVVVIQLMVLVGKP